MIILKCHSEIRVGVVVPIKESLFYPYCRLYIKYPCFTDVYICERRLIIEVENGFFFRVLTLL